MGPEVIAQLFQLFLERKETEGSFVTIKKKSIDTQDTIISPILSATSRKMSKVQKHPLVPSMMSQRALTALSNE